MRSKVLATLALVGLFFVAGCGEPVEGDEAASESEEALAKDEVEAAILVDGIVSSAPKKTGVDRWRLSLVKKEGVKSPFLVAIGQRSGKEVLDVVLAASPEGSTTIRVAAEEGTELTQELRDALAADLVRIRKSLAPEWTEEAMEEEVRRREARAASPKVDCSKLQYAKQLNEGALLFTGAVMIPACGPGVLAAGVSIPVCVFYAGLGAVQLFRTVRARSAFAECVAETNAD